MCVVSQDRGYKEKVKRRPKITEPQDFINDD